MNRMRTKLAIAAIVLISAVGYLALAGASKGWVYYLDVDSYLADASYQTQRVRLAGRVDEQDLNLAPAKLTASFQLLGPTRKIGITYHGVIPDTFKAGADVVVEGRLDDQGVFQADTLMTKCASKYQAEEHAKRLEQKP
ncbi:MAG: cytochrome c maturation protein CcmE [Phycisphaeraceae bacterium]|nr:cytochrome c maturation protein CcmE [Phycisphaeraceae bacterium]